MTTAIIFGTRPEAIKVAPIARALRDRGARFVLVSTGQHRELLDVTCSQLGLVPDVDLATMRQGASLAALTARLTTAIDRCLGDIRAERVIVQGDTTTAFVGALAAYYRGVPVAHVEAGLRTENLFSPFPEEGNRRLITPLASYHFAPTARAASALRSEGVPPHQIHVTGNTVIDALLWAVERAPEGPARERELRALVTLHRRENHGAPLRGILRAIRDLVEQYPLEIVLPVHQNPAVRPVVIDELQGLAGVHLVDPLGYLDLVGVLKSCDFVMTDSGGLQEEAPALGKPVLVLRDTTERPEAVEFGAAMLVGTDRHRIVAAAQMLIEDSLLFDSMSAAVNPFGDGCAAERIVGVLDGEPVACFDPAAALDALAVVA